MMQIIPIPTGTSLATIFFSLISNPSICSPQNRIEFFAMNDPKEVQNAGKIWGGMVLRKHNSKAGKLGAEFKLMLLPSLEVEQKTIE